MKQNNYIKHIILYSIVLLVSLTFFSCHESSDQKKYNLLRKEVLAHYKTDPNPKKEIAARFLLDNLYDMYSIDGERYKTYSDTIKRYYRDASILHKKLITVRDSPYASETIKDIDVLSPKYLIDNIDRAFAAWEKAGWKDQVSFENFCEYILPYRIGNEPLESWRNEIVQDTIFKITGDTIFSSTDIETAAIWLTKRFSKLKNPFDIKWGADAADIPDMPYSTLKLLTSGTCTHVSQISLLTYRSAGIPIANDFTPHWANNTSGHNWTAIITKFSSIPFSIIGSDTLRKYKSPDYIPSKVFRHTFSANGESHAKQRGYCKFLPVFF